MRLRCSSDNWSGEYLGTRSVGSSSLELLPLVATLGYGPRSGSGSAADHTNLPSLFLRGWELDLADRVPWSCSLRSQLWVGAMLGIRFRGGPHEPTLVAPFELPQYRATRGGFRHTGNSILQIEFLGVGQPGLCDRVALELPRYGATPVGLWGQLPLVVSDWNDGVGNISPEGSSSRNDGNSIRWIEFLGVGQPGHSRPGCYRVAPIWRNSGRRGFEDRVALELPRHGATLVGLRRQLPLVVSHWNDGNSIRWIEFPVAEPGCLLSECVAAATERPLP